ncbi:MAG: TonB-dependent receptor [Acidobacteria bacterium]|nr:TonB-dependent receptor [Acidobacteriota bacterium]
MSRTFFHLVLGTGLGLSLHAADAADLPKPKGAASATVTVTAEASQVDTVKSPNPVKVITQEEIQRSGARTLAELLQRELPGQVSQSGGSGTEASPQLGGTRPQDTLVLLDGIRLVDASGLGTNLSEISLAGVVRVEIQRGPVSGLYGSDAQGGVIALYTDAPTEAGHHGDWSLGLGTHGLARLGGTDSIGWGSGGARLALNGGRQDAPTEADNRFREGSVFLGLNQAIGDSQAFSLAYRSSFSGTPIPYESASLDHPFTYDAARQDTARSQQVIGAVRSGWGADWGTELSLGYAEQTREEPNDFGPSPSSYRYRSYGSQANALLHWTPSGPLSGSLLLQGVQERAKDDFGDLGNGRHLGAALELAWEPFDALRLVGSARAQRDHQALLDASGASKETANSQTTGKLGATWQMGGGFRVYASGGSAFSNPLLYAVLYNAGPFVNGPQLHNEQSHSLQAGFGFDQGPWHARLDAWRTKMDEAVIFDLSDYTYKNHGQLLFQGVEGAVDYTPGAWSLGAWARSQEARDLKLQGDQQLSGGGVLRRPFFAFGLKGEATWGAFRGDLSWSWQGSRYEYFGYDATFTNAVYGPSRVHYNDLGGSLAWTIRDGMSLTLRGENLLQPRITAADWLARRTDFQNDAYQVYNFPANPPTVSLEFRIRY